MVTTGKQKEREECLNSQKFSAQSQGKKKILFFISLFLLPPFSLYTNSFLIKIDLHYFTGVRQGRGVGRYACHSEARDNLDVNSLLSPCGFQSSD